MRSSRTPTEQATQLCGALHQAVLTNKLVECCSAAQVALPLSLCSSRNCTGDVPCARDVEGRVMAIDPGMGSRFAGMRTLKLPRVDLTRGARFSQSTCAFAAQQLGMQQTAQPDNLCATQLAKSPAGSSPPQARCSLGSRVLPPTTRRVARDLPAAPSLPHIAPAGPESY